VEKTPLRRKGGRANGDHLIERARTLKATEKREEYVKKEQKEVTWE